MPPARFSHQAHTPLINCTTCHHTGYVDGKSLLCTSSGCHDGLTATLRTDKNAAHAGILSISMDRALHVGYT